MRWWYKHFYFFLIFPTAVFGVCQKEDCVLYLWGQKETSKCCLFDWLVCCEYLIEVCVCWFISRCSLCSLGKLMQWCTCNWFNYLELVCSLLLSFAEQLDVRNVVLNTRLCLVLSFRHRKEFVTERTGQHWRKLWYSLLSFALLE